ncbi:MAG TPA: GTPase HflX [Lacipirellulaceae bacterium]|nr:GTPase HflX [Lacipirellulaceae bacterium]
MQERTLIVGVDVPNAAKHDGADATPEESLAELRVLADSAGAEIVDEILQRRPALDPATLIGSGKVDEIRLRVEAAEIDSVIFDHDLSPTQLRNLERNLGCKVVDRTQLILDIFATRARTREGQLQVELAQLNYLLPRLAGRGTQMSRLGGGIGTRGPGETQLETDRRRIGQRIAKLRADIERVRATRGTQRSQRQAVPLSTVSLVGYTNAGKSTLFNRLTGAGVLADARMFATLDPIVRQIRLPSGRRVLLSDTVGFIRNLPTTLVDAFRATLEEVTAAALLLHVVDVTSSVASEQTTHVMRVLTEIGAQATPQILVLNKADRLENAGLDQNLDTLVHRILGETARQNETDAVIVSGQTGQGIDTLLETIDRKIGLDPVARQKFRLPLGEGRALHLLYERAAIVSREYSDEYCEVVADAPQSLRTLLARFAVP